MDQIAPCTTKMAKLLRSWSTKAPAADADYEKEIEQLRQKTPIPSIWLFGKTGSGKSSIIRYLTGAEAAVIGEGYRPETKTSRRFDFPDSIEPLLTFIDTRGLGEATYGPESDIERFSGTSQLMVVAVRVTDHALEAIIEPLRRIRKAAPQRPTLLVLTCLHEATGTIDISSGPDPFDAQAVTGMEPPPPIPPALQVLIDEKIKQFEGLHDAVIPVDLTKPGDGFANPNFGGPRLKQAILEYLPHAYRQALLALDDSDRRESHRHKRVRWQVLASSALAASAGAVPVPWVDIPVVLGVQTHLALRIAAIYEQEITPADWALLSGVTGSRIALRLALLEGLKFIPFLGMAAGAASSFAFTYALGMSWDWYFANAHGDNAPSPDKIKEIFREQLKRGHELWRAE